MNSVLSNSMLCMATSKFFLYFTTTINQPFRRRPFVASLLSESTSVDGIGNVSFNMDLDGVHTQKTSELTITNYSFQNKHESISGQQQSTKQSCCRAAQTEIIHNKTYNNNYFIAELIYIDTQISIYIYLYLSVTTC